MQLARVIGDVVATRKDGNLHSRTLLVLQPIGADGRPSGRTLVAVDAVGAGVGETVFFVRGKEASFLAGGEFPIPVAQGGSGSVAIAITFKEFGVRLNFTPTVTGDNRVRLKVRPEVSTLDFANAIVLQGFRIPALSTRRTETELELDNGSGQPTSIAAGLIADVFGYFT